MAPQLEYFVTDERGIRGPFSAEALREAIASQSLLSARARVPGCEPWLPFEAWEGLADLCASPDAPPAPTSEPTTKLPAELTRIAPAVREKLLWFVADSDGVMGPVSGEFIRRGLTSGKIKMGVGICLVSSTGWVRASIAFPSALEGATAVRPRPFVTFPCPACCEPCAATDIACTACDEPIRKPPRAVSERWITVAILVTWLVICAIAIGVGLLIRVARSTS